MYIITSIDNHPEATTKNNYEVQGIYKEEDIPPGAHKSNKIKPVNNTFVKEEPTWKENLRAYFAEYCTSSGIHGVRYLGESGRLITEKLIWAGILTIMCYLCLGLILKSYGKWRSSPVIISFATTETSIWKIPFPAVTICSTVKSDPDIFNYSRVFLEKMVNSNITPKENDIFESLTLICRGLSSLPDVVNQMKENGSLTVKWGTIENIINVSPPISEDEYVIWLGEEYKTDVLTKVFTSKGLCYSFNIIDSNALHDDPNNIQDEVPSGNNYTNCQWSLERGYVNDEDIDVFPRRTLSSGINSGLVIDLITNKSHIDHYCSDSHTGFHVAIHNPAESSSMESSFEIGLNQIASIAIKPKMIVVSEQLKQYKPEYRKCYFANERYLRYFSTYSQQKCLEECLTNFTIKSCGCIGFYMPRSKSFPICGAANLDCVQTSSVEYLLNEDGSDSSCNCLPSCTSLEYEVEISQNNWSWQESFTILRSLLGDKYSEVYGDIDSFHLTRLIVYFKEMQFFTLERHELYGKTEFFSNTGGLLGLFIGFSITSAIEILYFLTLRIICNVKKFGRKFWSGRNNSSISFEK